MVLEKLQRITFRFVTGGTIFIGTTEILTKLPSEGRSSEFYHYLANDIATPFTRSLLNPEGMSFIVKTHFDIFKFLHIIPYYIIYSVL